MWTPECERAFVTSKYIPNAPVPFATNFDWPFKLQVDASASGAGAVLIQEDVEGVEHPVSYYSKKCSNNQLHYSAIEKEALALLLALQHFEVYVGGSSTPVIVYTDHNPLIFLSRMYNTNQRLMRWALIIQEHNLDIRNQNVSDNVIADALPRVHSPEVYSWLFTIQWICKFNCGGVTTLCVLLKSYINEE